MNIKDLIPWEREDKFWSDNPFSVMERDMNRMFRDFSKNFMDAPVGTGWKGVNGMTPKLDVTETDEAIEVHAELPGMEEKDIEVSLLDNVLTLEGEKKHEKETKEKNYHRVERSFGKFQRRVALPAEVQSDKVDATFKKGVLTVRLPKTEKAKKDVKKISVKAE